MEEEDRRAWRTTYLFIREPASGIYKERKQVCKESSLSSLVGRLTDADRYNTEHGT